MQLFARVASKSTLQKADFEELARTPRKDWGQAVLVGTRCWSVSRPPEYTVGSSTCALRAAAGSLRFPE